MTTPSSSRGRDLAMGRSTGDVARLVIAVVVAIVSFVAAGTRTVDPIESAIYRQLAQLPRWLQPVSHVAVLAGSVADIAVAAGIALFLRRTALGARLVVGGTAAWVISYLSARLTHPRVVSLSLAGHHEVVRTVFPSEHMAVAAALATVATPYLPRALHRLVVPAMVVVALALDFTGHQLALNLVAGGAIGWATGSAVHLATAAPGRSLSAEVVAGALAAAGLDVAGLVVTGASLLGPRTYEAVTPEGVRLEVEMVWRGQRRAGWTYKLRRLLASLDVQDEPALSSPRHEVDHEAFVTLLAERGGVRTPRLITAGDLGHGPALLVRHKVPGRRLSEMGAEECGDDLLDEIWRNVQRLGRAGVAHHNLLAANVLVDGDARPWLLDFTFARAAAGRARLAQDVAEMLVSLTSVVGAERAVSSAARVVGDAQLRAALPYLQPLALPAHIRNQLRARPLLVDLSEGVAKLLGEPRPLFRPRLRVGFVVSMAVAGAAVYILLPQIGSVPELLKSVRSANYWWLVAAFAAGVLTFPMATASYLGATRTPMPFWRTTWVQVAAAFTSRLTPGGIGGMALNLVYLERQGATRPDAIGSVALNQSVGVVVHAALFVVAIGFLGTSGVVGKVTLPSGWPILVAVVVVLVALGLVLASARGRRRVLIPAARVIANMAATVAHPWRALGLFLGSAGVTVGNAVALAATLAAFDPHFAPLPVIAVYIGGAAIASAAPTPGSLGAVEAALVAGLTGIGIASTQAVAAVLTFRLLTFWLPMLPGLATLRYLQHRRIV